MTDKKTQPRPEPAVAAIEFALTTDEGLAFLGCWNEGEFEAIRSEWPDAPEEVFIGADPMHPGTKAFMEAEEAREATLSGRSEGG